MVDKHWHSGPAGMTESKLKGKKEVATPVDGDNDADGGVSLNGTTKYTDVLSGGEEIMDAATALKQTLNVNGPTNGTNGTCASQHEDPNGHTTPKIQSKVLDPTTEAWKPSTDTTAEKSDGNKTTETSAASKKVQHLKPHDLKPIVDLPHREFVPTGPKNYAGSNGFLGNGTVNHYAPQSAYNLQPLPNSHTMPVPNGGLVQSTLNGSQTAYNPLAIGNGPRYPIPSNGGIPLSLTYPQYGQGSLSQSNTESSLDSYQQTPVAQNGYNANGAHNGVFSPEQPPASMAPPPRFDLSTAGPYGMPANNGALVLHSNDPFITNPRNGNYQPTGQMSPAHHQPVPDHIRKGRSDHLNRLTEGPTGRPTLEQAMHPDNLPFLVSFQQSTSAIYGVVKLKNIPFSTKRAEIIAFLGRNSKILNDYDEGVHIIMERVTSKTNDAYVEFMTLHDAMKAVEKFNVQSAKGRTSRLGDRPIDVELSSQAALMKDLFPLARGVFWDGSYPKVMPAKEREPWTTFRGFISEEEMTMLVKHVEVPQRSPFSRDCPQRPFECMISTLKKLPWYMTDLISVRQRQAVYRACIDLVKLLQDAIKHGRNQESLTKQLLKRLATAAMMCAGFTILMKDNIAWEAGLGEQELHEFGLPRFANCWTHQWTLAPRVGMPFDVIEWYIAVIREESSRFVNSLPLNDRARVQGAAAQTNDYWGYFWAECAFPIGPAFDNLSLSAVALLECNALERILGRAFAH